MRTKLFLVLIILVSAAALNAATIKLDRLAELSAFDFSNISYADWPQIHVSQNFALPAKEFIIEMNANQALSHIVVSAVQLESLGQLPAGVSIDDAPTSLDGQYDQILSSLHNDRLGSQTVHILGETTIDGKRFARFLLFPVTIDSHGELFFCDSLTLQSNQIDLAPNGVITPESVPGYSETATTDLGDDFRSPASSLEYVIITNAALAESFQPLFAYKKQTGYRTSIMLVEDILTQYSGRDSAEKIREYLKQFHAEGGKYVMLGGDETVVPIRYAYNSDADEPVPPLQLQVADLYFADLTGEWNRDNDSVWGERTDDAPDLTPELLVGRLPVNSPDEVRNYFHKLIRYETNPGNGDPSYVNRAFFFSADQMRDYTPSSQHNYIARAYPSAIEIDTANGVEAIRGDDPAPTNLAPRDLSPVLSQGYGIINILAHGRDDGFAVKTSGYNAGMRAMLWTNASSGESNTFANLQATDRPAFYYSLACDNGAFDLSSPPFNYGTRNMAQELIGERDGAVGMVAYSRWGWIGTSYILQKVFFDSLFAHPDRPAMQAMNACKAKYPYYRDLILGQNYFGDPTLKVYTSVPAIQSVQAFRLDDTTLKITVQANGQSSLQARVIVSDISGILADMTIGQSGEALVSLESNPDHPICITAVKSGCTVAQTWYSPSIVTDVEDSDPLRPAHFSLSQNYPNPFNPTTLINFTLPQSVPAKLIIYDLLGRHVVTLIDGQLNAGKHQVKWSGVNSVGNTVGAGVYFYRLTAGAENSTKKMLLLK